MLDALDRDARPERGAEQLQLRRAEALTRVRRGADGAVVLYEKKSAALGGPHLCHVALLRANARKLGKSSYGEYLLRMLSERVF